MTELSDLPITLKRLIISLGRWSPDTLAPGLLWNAAREQLSGPDRFYHNIEHIVYVAERLVEYELFPEQCPEVHLAAWFHDWIYQSGAPKGTNEARSAEAFPRVMKSLYPSLSLPEGVLVAVSKLISMTADHTTAVGELAQKFSDADLAILGESEGEYHRYADAIRKECLWNGEITSEQYQKGRRQFLESFLEHCAEAGTIYYAQSGQRNVQARLNMTRELSGMDSTVAEFIGFLDRGGAPHGWKADRRWWVLFTSGGEVESQEFLSHQDAKRYAIDIASEWDGLPNSITLIFEGVLEKKGTVKWLFAGRGRHYAFSQRQAVGAR